MKYLKLIFSLVVFFVLLQPARAEIPPKAKAMLTVAGYGAGGGALLGVASMAFGTSSRAIAQGASLGLYAGLLFGAYILVTHENKGPGYDDRDSPYRDDEGSDYDGGGEQQESRNYIPSSSNDRIISKVPPIYVNVLTYQF